MNFVRPVGARILLWAILLLALSSTDPARAQGDADEVRVKEIHGLVEYSTDGGSKWAAAKTNQVLSAGHHLRTGPNSRAMLLAPPGTGVPCKELTEVEILPPNAAGAGPGLHIIRGLLSLFHRDKPERIRTVTTAGVAGVKGTEFVIAVEKIGERERTTLFVIDGEVQFTNALGTLTLTNGEQAVLEAGAVPARAAGPAPANLVQWANNLLQWAFYYPAVLDPQDLSLTANETQALGESLAAYRAGDLPGALAAYGARQPASEAERLYHAALLLSVGKSEESSAALAQLEQANASDRGRRLAAALRQQIATVQREPVLAPSAPRLTTELLAASYFEQARAGGDATLQRALDLARRAASNAPQFGFAWVRVAELEFSFGRTGKALEALEKSLTLSPRNAQALALKGFLLAAQNQPHQAIEWFDRAIATDASLANAWLGRGLCRIRRGDLTGGREDLLLAAALEPRRAQLRSYLGKSFGDAGDSKRALHELTLAQQLDANDPSAFLYSALLKSDHNQINEAISDLEKSQELNDNRSVYRSSLLLDQDRSVRSANLARIYRDAGMAEWSVLEAARAISADYANYSAHLFLANSYDELRDPNRVNLRYETPAESEYLIANLLAPVGAGLLAQSVSQQEYSKLFERDRFGVSSSTEYLSRGAWVERGAQYGVWGNSSYLVEGLYSTDPGERRNGDFKARELRLHLKQQLTPQDSIYFRAIDYEAAGGDVIQYYDPRQEASRGRRTHETFPTLNAGYHHEWSPGVHTLLLAGRLRDSYAQDDPLEPTLFIIRPSGQAPTDFELMRANLRYRRSMEVYSTELQQIIEQGDHHTILGGRFQTGEIHTKSRQTDPTVLGEIIGYFEPGKPIADQNFTDDLERISFYAYHDWQVHPALRLIGGVAWDHLTHPANFRAPPLSEGEEETQRLSPKAGLIWTPTPSMTFRLGWAQSLAGVSIDQSYLLEPSQIAGFNQSFRSVIPESLGASGIGARFETFGAALEYKIGSATYVGVSGHILNSREKAEVGAFRYDGNSFFAQPSHTAASLDYTEKTLVVSLNQLIKEEWFVGVSYRLTHAELAEAFTEVPKSTFVLGLRPKENLSAELHQLFLQAGYHHSSGFFSLFQALWSEQSNRGYSPDLPGDDFWQLNAFAGWRSPGRKVELRVGVLNLCDQDYRLNPLTLYTELPRSRTLSVRLQFSF